MAKCLFDRATGVYVSGSSYDDIPHDDATKVQIELVSFPDKRTRRWDVGTGVRAATSAEIASYDADALAAEAQAATGVKVMKAVVLYMLDQINALRAATIPPLPALTAAQAMQGVIDKYKAL